MAMDPRRLVNVAVEGDHDVAVAERVLAHVGLPSGGIRPFGGDTRVLSALRGLNNYARSSRWLVLLDLDLNSCAPALRQKLLPYPAEHMRLRIVVCAIEAWLLADEEAICDFLEVEHHHLKGQPEESKKPKLKLVELAKKSRNREIKADMIPAFKTSQVGPGYTDYVIRFAREHWRPEVAMTRSDSLQRCIKRLQEWAK